MLLADSLVASFVERRVGEHVHRRELGPIAGDETLAEVPDEVLVGGLGLRPCDAAQAVPQLDFHLEPRKGGEDSRRALLRDPVVEKARVIRPGPAVQIPTSGSA